MLHLEPLIVGGVVKWRESDLGQLAPFRTINLSDSWNIISSSTLQAHPTLTVLYRLSFRTKYLRGHYRRTFCLLFRSILYNLKKNCSLFLIHA